MNMPLPRFDHSIRRLGALIEDTKPKGFRSRDLTLDERRDLSTDVNQGPFGRRSADDMAGAMYAMFGPLRKVAPVTASVREPNDRLLELVTMDRPLTANEWVELTAFERAADAPAGREGV